MRKISLILLLVAIVSPGLWATWDPIAQAPELPPGWSPAQASDWQGVKIQYAQSIKRYGARSPEAAEAHTRMAAMSRVLRPDQVYQPEGSASAKAPYVDFRQLTVITPPSDFSARTQ